MSSPAPRPNEVMRAVRPEAEPLMRPLPTSTVTTVGRLTVCAVPRTHIAASWHTNTASIVHFMGSEPSYGAAKAERLIAGAAGASLLSRHGPSKIRRRGARLRRLPDARRDLTPRTGARQDRRAGSVGRGKQNASHDRRR